MHIRTLLAGLVAAFMTLTARANVDVGDKPQLRLRTLDNQTLTSKEMEGKIIVLEFWATWCPPCVQLVPHLRELNAKYAKQGVRLVSVSLDRGRGEAMTFIRRNGMNWTHVMDNEQPGGPLSNAFGVEGIPYAFILSPQGQVLWHGSAAHLDAPLERAIKEHPPKPSPEIVRDEAIAAITRAAELIDKRGDYAAAYQLIAKLESGVLQDPKVAPKFRSLAIRFRPSGQRAEAVAKFYEDHPEAKVHLAKLGVEVELATTGSQRESDQSGPR